MPVWGSLRERGQAMELVATMAERARAGTGGLILVKGASGTGRTALLEAAAEHATEHGMQVLRARCWDEASAPYASVRQMLGCVPGFCPNEPGNPGNPDAPDAGAWHTADPLGHDVQWRVHLWQLLTDRAAEAPLLVAVDDVHTADQESRIWLVGAARHADRLPILLVVSERSQYDIDPPPAGFAHTLSPALVRTHTLAPLSADGVAALVHSALGVAVPAHWVDACLRASAGGNPLLLHALLDDLRATYPDGRWPASVPDTCAALYPGGYPAAVTWWLDSAGQDTADVARSLAALDDGPTGDTGLPAGEDAEGDGAAALLAAMAGADPARIAGWLTAMTRLGLLRRTAGHPGHAVGGVGGVGGEGPAGCPRYAHPLLRDAVLSGWPGARRQAAHRTAAQEMLRRGDRVVAVARQLLQVSAVGEPWAAGVLVEAAATAVTEVRLPDARAFLCRALEEPLPAGMRAAVLTELGSLEWATARPAAGISRLAEAVRLPGGPGNQVRAAVALGTALAGRGEPRIAVDVLRSLDGQLTGHPELVRTLHNAAALLSDHDRTTRQEMYRSLRERAEHAPHLVGVAGRALLVRYESTAGLTSAHAAMERIRNLLAQPADPLEEPFLLGTSAAVAQWADELDEAERLVERGLAVQRTALLHPTDAALLNVRVDIAAARGRYADLLAEHGADGPGPPQAIATPRIARHRHAPTNRHAHAVVALVETGRMEQAAALADGFELHHVPESWELNRFFYARGVLHAARGEPAAALDDFLACGRRQAARDVFSPVVTPWRTAAAECRLALGRPAQALDLAREELRLATVWDTPRLVGRALRVLGAATGGRHGLRLADQAVGLLRDSAADSELVQALIGQGRLLMAGGERARARQSLREAAEHAERMGTVRLRRAAEEALRAGGARRVATARTGSAALTGSERRIAELAAEGRTNPEIAQLLHLARRTVETHLTSAYRKLGIRRRAELRTALEDTDLRPPPAGESGTRGLSA